MTDYKRMERHYYYNRAAVVVLVFLVLLEADEIKWAFRYHFPWWDDIMMPITTLLAYCAWFVKRHTDMYRFDVNRK